MATIMIVDDEPAAVQPLYALLVREGYEVQPVSSSGDLMNMVRASRPDMLLLSSAVRVANIDDLCHQLTQNFPNTTLLLLSEGPSQAARAQLAGAAGYLERTLRHDEMLAHIKTYLHARCCRQMRVLSERIRSVTHQVSSPVAPIDINLYLLKRHGRVDDAYGQQIIDRIGESSAQISTLIRELRKAVRFEVPTQ
ncbi:MAG: response regulator transcription factor [Blastochloris sp.]|nr:response regulator transcription factor [Blastochloris sp.]